MTHNTWVAIQNLSNLCLFLAEIRLKFNSKDTTLRNITQTTSIPNFINLFLLLAEIIMKFHSEDTSLRNMTHNTSIPNQISQFCAYFWLKLV